MYVWNNLDSLALDKLFGLLTYLHTHTSFCEKRYHNRKRSK